MARNARTIIADIENGQMTSPPYFYGQLACPGRPGITPQIKQDTKHHAAIRMHGCRPTKINIQKCRGFYLFQQFDKVKIGINWGGRLCQLIQHGLAQIDSLLQ